MEDLQSLVKTTMGEIEKMLNTKTVFGEPTVIDGKTLIPLIAVGFGFGAGMGNGKANMKQSQEGMGGGTGGGAGIRPIAVIISDKDGIRIETVKSGFAAALEKMAETCMPLMMKKCGMQEESSAK